MFQTLENSILKPCAISFPEITFRGLGGQVEVLYPAMVIFGRLGRDVVLEDDHVGVRYLLSELGGEYGSGIVVDCVDNDGRGTGEKWEKWEELRDLHDDGGDDTSVAATRYC